MGLIQLYIATSIDGYIADDEGRVDWLEAFLVGGEDYGYGEFLADVGAVAMGATTYEQELERGSWPYGERPTWVFTHRALERPAGGDVRFTQEPPAVVARDLREQPGNTFLVGGGVLARQFLDAGGVDELIQSIAPVVLGGGIPLFARGAPTSAQLVGCESFATGLVQVRYQRANA